MQSDGKENLTFMQRNVKLNPIKPQSDKRSWQEKVHKTCRRSETLRCPVYPDEDCQRMWLWRTSRMLGDCRRCNARGGKSSRAQSLRQKDRVWIDKMHRRSAFHQRVKSCSAVVLLSRNPFYPWVSVFCLPQTKKGECKK